MVSRLPRRSWGTILGVTGFVVAVVATLAWLSSNGVDPAVLGLLAALAVVALVGLLARTVGRTASTVRRVVGDTAVILDVNPSHRVGAVGAGDLRPLVHAVNRLAERHESALRDAERRAEAARRDMETERNRLAALMAQLTVAVVLCNSEGRILLYNQAARSLLGEGTPVGLGRSVFGVVDRGLVAHALARLTTGADSVYTATTLHGDKLVRVRVTLVREPSPDEEGAASGFVLVLEDTTREARAQDRRDRLNRRLTEVTRGSLGSIRAAVESVLEFPEASEAEQRQFLDIVRDEADRLGRRIEEVAVAEATVADDLALAEIAAEDLLGLVGDEIERVTGATVHRGAVEPVWLRADAHALARAVAAVTVRLEAGSSTLVLGATERHVELDLRWPGSAPAAASVNRWLDEPLAGAGTASARDVLDRHGAELWAGDLGGSTAYLRVLMPLPVQPAAVTPVRVRVPSRPEAYDFDLFTAVPQPANLADRRLDQMSFTVFDTETTGLEPTAGDRVISLGAVRVVNGRVVRQETFEQLVHPRRPVPASSTAIHGITGAMLEGSPPITEVLPVFARFAEDTVLVGHNVSFDLQFLALAEPEAGVTLPRPVLDTLLLHAAVEPEQERHTLEAIADRLGVSVVGRHTALGDALVTAEVFVALVALLRQQGVTTFGQALALSQSTYHARVDRRLYGA